MWQVSRVFRAAVIAVVLAGAGASQAGSTDLHAFWDQRCSECHAHSAAFARRFLSAKDGQLIGRHHRDDLLTFLGQHHMGPSEAPRIHAMLLAQVTTPPVFQERCARCHGTAAELARTSLDRIEGELIGRPKGRRLSQFLLRHGGLASDEVGVVLKRLDGVLDEIRGGASK